MTELTNARGQSRQLEYDAAGRLTRWTDPEGTVSYTYDNNGNILTVTDAQGTITRTFDALNRVTSYTDVNGNTLRYAYDAVGNLVTLIYPDNKQVHYEYDAVNQLVKVTDWSGRETRYEYDANGRLIKTLRPNGTVQTRQYDVKGQLLTQTDVDVQGNVLVAYAFSYDAAGNIIQEQITPEQSLVLPPSVEMTYTAANRLVTFNGQAVQFDADGNLLTAPLQGQMSSLQFDSRNRLIQAGNTSCRYDAENQRIGANQTQYVVNSQPALSQILVKDENGVKTFYVYGLGLIGEETNGHYRTYHFDYRGSTVVLTNLTGQVTQRFQYAPYGELVSGDASQTPFLFNGMYGVMTDDNGLYYMRARFYSPEIKRFVNQDVLLGNVAEGQTLNRFAFVIGNPISLVDPFGYSSGIGDIPFYKEDTTVGELHELLEFYFGAWNWSCPLMLEPIPIVPPRADVGENMQKARKCFDPTWFYNQVRNKGPWDYKQQGSQYENFGNFNFGATGCAFGFTAEILLRGAGWAQQRSGTSKPGFNNWWGSSPYGDDPNDQEMIKRGIEYCRCGH